MNNPTLKNASRRFAGLLQLLAWLFAWSAFPGHLEAAYQYPIGIPTAWIDPDVTQPARPDPWTIEIPGYYYVDYATGTDTGRTYGHPGAPRKTIPSPILAGSRVEVNGLYSATNDTFFITFEGGQGEWVANTSGPGWLVGSAKDKRASFTGYVYYVGKYGCIEFVDNFGSSKTTSFNSATSGRGRQAHHFLMRNSEFKGTNSANDAPGVGILGNTDIGGAGEDIVFYNNEVHHFGVTAPDGSDPDFMAIMIGDYCHRIWVLNNKLHDMSGSALQVTGNASSEVRTTHIYAGKNECYNLWGTGMAAKTSQYLVYSQNHVYNVREVPGVSPSKGIAGQYAATDQWIIFNRIHDCAHGIMRVSGNAKGEKLYVIGNVIYDIVPLAGNFVDSGWGEGGICLWGAYENYLIGNTLSNVPNGIVTPGASLIFVENNIIANINEANGEHFLAESSGPGKDIRFHNNLFYQDGVIKVSLPGVPVMDVSALNASTYGKGNLAGDPLFANAAGKDFSILISSSAKDAGRAPTALEKDVYALFFNTFGVSIERDKNGAVRPAGATWDIGAYEFQTSKITRPPDYRITPIQD